MVGRSGDIVSPGYPALMATPGFGGEFAHRLDEYSSTDDTAEVV